MYSKIDERFWSDEKVTSLSISARYLFLYFLTCPHRNVLGCYRLPRGYMLSDTNLNASQLSKSMNECIKADIVTYDDKAQVLFVHNFLRYNPIENSNQASGAQKRLADSPSSPLFCRVAEFLKHEEGEFNSALIKELLRKGGKLPEDLSRTSKKHSKPVFPSGDDLDDKSSHSKHSDTPDSHDNSKPLPEPLPQPMGNSESSEQLSVNPPKAPQGARSFLSDAQSVGFDEFWQLYPRKTGIARAERVWASINPDDKLRAVILAAVKNAIRLDERFREQRYTPNPSTWLSGREWLSSFPEKPQKDGHAGERSYTQEELDNIFFDPLAN